MSLCISVTSIVGGEFFFALTATKLKILDVFLSYECSSDVVCKLFHHKWDTQFSSLSLPVF